MSVKRGNQVLVITPDPDLNAEIVRHLNLYGIVADGVCSHESYMAWTTTHSCDVVFLDLDNPDIEGVDIIEDAKSRHGAKVIISTRPDDADARLRAYKSGAETYIPKPICLTELCFVSKNMSCRRGKSPISTNWKFDDTTWEITSPLGNTMKLTKSERVFIRTLAQNPGNIIRRGVVASEIGYDPANYDNRPLDTLIRRLRRKSEDILGTHLPLETVHGMGFSFTAHIEFL